MAEFSVHDFGLKERRSTTAVCETLPARVRRHDNSRHGVGVYRIVSRDGEYAAPVGHHDMLALANDSKASLLQRPHGVEVRYVGQFTHT